METILQDLLPNNSSSPIVQVLLATYNGEKYLEEFLESLLAQVGVRIHLITSDDGSSDSTLKILGHYAHKFHDFTQLEGPKKGPSANFFFLLRHADSNFVALADQDDIWSPNHLLNSLKRLSDVPDLPALSYSSVLEFNSDHPSHSTVLWPSRPPYDSIQSRLLENSARGCTVVINRNALILINMYEPKHAVMHDWWIYILISVSGVTKFGLDPEVKYRIHDNNVIGKSPKFGIKTKRFWNNFTRSSWASIDQMEELFGFYQWSLTSQNKHRIGSLIRDVRSSLLGGKLHLVVAPHRLRVKLIDELAFRLALLNPRLKRKGYGSTVIFIYTRLRRFIAVFTFYVYSFPTRYRNYVAIKITRKSDEITEVEIRDSLKSSKKIAVVALFPRPDILPSVKRLLKSLTNSGFDVLAVINKSSMFGEWKQSISGDRISIITRPNIGRDFGAYKAGFGYLKSLHSFDQYEKLLFANDSVYFGPRSEQFVEEMLTHDEAWLSMFVNYQFHTHAQSFFQIFDKSIFRQEKFDSFWRHYYPSDLRHRAINFGEVELSSTCLGLENSPIAFVTAERILTDARFHDFTQDEKFGIWSNHGYAFLNSELATNENTKFLMKRQYLENNVTHHQGLLASRVLGAPLKLDIFQTGQVTIEGVHDTLLTLGASPREASQIRRQMLSKGSHVSKTGLKRLWASYGLI